MTKFQKEIRKATLIMLEAGDGKKLWTSEEKNYWTRAFNALQRLSGHKIRK